MAINSRNKGNKNERIAAGLVSTWTGRKFERTPSSGGLQWKASFSKGDIVCTVEGHLCPFCFEIKAHKEINFSHLLVPKIKNIKILEFWEQCLRDARKCNKVPILMMRYNGMPKEYFFLAMPLDFANLLGIHKHNDSYLTIQKNQFNLLVMGSDYLFKLRYKEVRKLAKIYLNGKGK